MLITRLREIAHIHQFWPFFLSGLDVITKHTGDEFDVHELLPRLHSAVKLADKNFIAVCRDDNAIPQGFIIALDDTKPFSKNKTIEIVAIYHHRGEKEIGQELFSALMGFVAKFQYKTIYAKSRRLSSSAERYYNINYGLVKTQHIYSKEL